MKTVFLFPGQGSQSIGMGLAWRDAFPVAGRTFEEADEALGFSVSRLCFEGPDEELRLTENQQPAIVAVSVAIQRVLSEHGIAPVAVAGHSLGEYSALVCAGVLDFADTLRIVRRRGELMQAAVADGEGAMAAILGLDADAVRAVVDAVVEELGSEGSSSVCAVANLNSPEQTVISGHRVAVERAVERAQEAGAKRAVLLPVSAPFHSPLMRPATEGLSPMLHETEFSDPEVPVISNVDATPSMSGVGAREALIRQIESPVRWVECVEALTELGPERWIEVGPGSVLTGLLRRINRERGLSTADPTGLEKILNAAEGEGA